MDFGYKHSKLSPQVLLIFRRQCDHGCWFQPKQQVPKKTNSFYNGALNLSPHLLRVLVTLPTHKPIYIPILRHQKEHEEICTSSYRLCSLNRRCTDQVRYVIYAPLYDYLVKLKNKVIYNLE